MRITNFILYHKAFSINAATYRDSRFKSAAYKAWEAAILPDIPDLSHMAGFDYYEIQIEVEYPANIFFNKQGGISAKTFDVTNFEKLLVDLIMNKSVKTDDRYLVKCTSSKFSGAVQRIHISLKGYNKADAYGSVGAAGNS